MLNLHAWNVYMGILYVCTKLMKNDVVVNSWVILWLIVVVVVMRCRCWFMPMGVPFFEVVVLRVLMKMGQSWWIVIFDELRWNVGVVVLI